MPRRRSKCTNQKENLLIYEDKQKKGSLGTALNILNVYLFELCFKHQSTCEIQREDR